MKGEQNSPFNFIQTNVVLCIGMQCSKYELVVGRTFENSKVHSFTKALIVCMLTSNMGGAKQHFPLEAMWQILVRAVLVCARWHVQVMAVSNSATTSHSDVWKYISKDSRSASATCTLCEKVLAYRGGTSNLRDHLLCSHPREYHHKDKQQSTLDSIVKIRKIRSSFPVKGERSNGGFPHLSHH